ncbi:MAG TPA: T9SS type A sorting domain-containing protein [Bacteroidia bacterium]|nr:T9SS type A sorting domain-containing protein [Bacteroidia bacterium]
MKVKNLLIAMTVIVLSENSVKAHNPTWTDGIACIVYTHCTSCHNQNGIAPFSLMAYNDVFQNRFSIAASIQSKSMPPFPANQNKRKYAHANTLSKHEIDEIVDWVNNFAPLGDANNVPTPPTYSSGYQIINPDFVGQIPTYTVSSNNDVYRMFVIPVNNSTQQTIQSIEVYPGNREIVHHALVFQDTSLIPLTSDQNDSLPGYYAFGGTGSSSSKLLTVYTPGQGVFNFVPGFGAVLLPNSYIVIQMHYPGGVSGQVDSTQVRLKYGSSSLRNVTTIAALNHSSTLTNGPLFIPANTVKTFYCEVNNAANRTLTGIMPHMHLIGKSIKAYCVTPANDTIHLIDIPEWDFHWQYFYQFQKPILLPAGSVVYGEATYDNTTNNQHNPNNPPQDVNVGEGTEDEMFLIYMNLSSHLPGDTNIIVDTLSHYPHDESCFLTTGINDYSLINVDIYPNPTSDLIRLEGIKTTYLATIYTSEGKVVFTKINEPNNPLNIQYLNQGIYYLQIKTEDNEVVYKKIIRQ